MSALPIKTYTNQDALALEVDIANGELVGERHGCGLSTTVVAGLAELFQSFKNAIERSKERKRSLTILRKKKNSLFDR